MNIGNKDGVVRKMENASCWNDSTLSLMNGSPEVLYTINAVNALICFVGLSGNILVFYVVCRFSAMHTVTNIFILMLVLADIAILLNIPFLMTTAILENWPFGSAYCKIYYSMTTVNQFASSYFLVMMSADRFLAICHPVLARRLRTTRNALFVCVVVWSLAIVLMYPVFLYAEIDSNSEGYSHCNIFWPDYFDVSGNHAFVLYCFLLGYACPVTFMITFYGLVVRKLRSRQNLQQQAAVSDVVSPSSFRRRSRLRRVTVMIFIVIVVFLLCWTPYWISQLTIVFSSSNQYDHLLSCPITPADIRASQTIVYTSLILQCLCFANSAINPILYAILSENFQQSYAKACHRTTNSEVPEPSSVRELSWQPQFVADVKSSFREHAPVDQDSGRVYLNSDRQLQDSPTYVQQSDGFAAICGNLEEAPLNAPGIKSARIPLLKGEVVTSLQITTWNPTSKTQQKVVATRTMLTTFEMSTVDRTACEAL